MSYLLISFLLVCMRPTVDHKCFWCMFFFYCNNGILPGFKVLGIFKLLSFSWLRQVPNSSDMLINKVDVLTDSSDVMYPYKLLFSLRRASRTKLTMFEPFGNPAWNRDIPTSS